MTRSVARLRAFGEVSTTEDAWRVVNEYSGWGEFASILPTQRKSEACGLVELLRTEKVRSACEVGSYLGGMLYMMTRILPDDARIYSIDYPEVDERMGSFPRARKPFTEKFARARQHLEIIYGDSRHPSTLERLKKAMGGEPLDFLMIDADHTYEGVLSDFQTFAPLVRVGGIIAFHDIVADEKTTLELFGYSFGSPTLWNQLREKYETEEIIDPETLEKRNGGGIGILRWNGEMIELDKQATAAKTA